jgi:hypothetical protein
MLLGYGKLQGVRKCTQQWKVRVSWYILLGSLSLLNASEAAVFAAPAGTPEAGVYECSGIW